MIPAVIPITLAGRQLNIRYSCFDLIKAEAELGKSIITTLKNADNIGISELSIIIKHGLRSADMHPVTDAEYTAILDGMTTDEFLKSATAIISRVFNTEEESQPPKNE